MTNTLVTEQRLGTIAADEMGIFIEDCEYGIAMSLPKGVMFSVGEKVLYTIPNPIPGIFVEDFHDKVSQVEPLVIITSRWGIS